MPSAAVVAPPVPFGVVVTPSAGQVSLQWTYEENATSYQVYRGTTPGGEGATPLATVTSSSYTDTAVTSGTTYYYEITALTGTTASARSTEYSANTNGTTGTAPATPIGLVASAGNASVGLTWTASAGATSYSVYRGTAAGAEGATAVGTSTSNSFTNTGLTNGTTYYYTITASNAAGTSAKSAEVHATPTTTTGTGGVQISAGGPAAAPFVADEDFTGGATSNTTHAITTTGLTNPAPQSVYQHNRYGNFTYTVTGLTAGASYTVRLHFAEEYWTAAGSRTFNVLINGTQVLTNFDIYATAGGEYIAVIEPFTATASSTGTITIQFVTVKDNAQVNGIEILPA